MKLPPKRTSTRWCLELSSCCPGRAWYEYSIEIIVIHHAAMCAAINRTPTNHEICTQWKTKRREKKARIFGYRHVFALYLMPLDSSLTSSLPPPPLLILAICSRWNWTLFSENSLASFTILIESINSRVIPEIGCWIGDNNQRRAGWGVCYSANSAK